MPTHAVESKVPVATREGVFMARYTRHGLAALEFPGTGADSTRKGSPLEPEVQRWHSLTASALAAALAGSRASELPPLDLSAGTPFQQRVWKALQRIPPGQTRSYGQVARAIGKPGAARAVGGACGANPIPVLIPCHRVLAANGKLGGFSGGLDRKRRLLAIEGQTFPAGRSRRSQV